MPELPEVEVLRRQLEKEYVGKRIKNVDVKTRQYVKEAKPSGKRVTKRNITPKEFDKQLAGGKVKGVHRKGKYLAFELDNKNYLVFHLGMSGHLVKATGKRAPDKHTHVIIHFTQGGDVRFFDARRFGECFVADAEAYTEAMDGLGIDAINDQIPWQLFGEHGLATQGQDEVAADGPGVHGRSRQHLFGRGALPGRAPVGPLVGLAHVATRSVVCRAPSVRCCRKRSRTAARRCRTANGATCTTSPVSTRTRCWSTGARASRAAAAVPRSRRSALGSARTTTARSASPRGNVSPVCPACRAKVAFGTHACWRCGLAIRPTCARCGEPLMHGMSECWFCREPVEEAGEEVPVPVARSAATTATIPITVPLVDQRVRTYQQVSYPLVSRKRFSFWRGLRRGIGCGLLAALGLIGLEMAFPRFTTTSSGSSVVEDRRFSDRGFGIAIPAGWEMHRSDPTLSFVSPERTFGRSTRGLRVTTFATSFKKVEASIDANRRRVTGYRLITRKSTTLDGEKAVAAVFAGNALRFEQWWVAADKGMMRVELWSRQADDDAIALNRRIAGSFELL